MHEQLDPGSTALVLFDFLNGHVKKSDFPTTARYAPVVEAAARLLKYTRAAGLMVAYANAAHRADNATSATTLRDTDNRLRPIPGGADPRFQPTVVAGSWEAQVIGELTPRPDEYIVPKYRWSAFYQTYLELALRTRGVGTIVLAGGSTDVGIASTIFAARDMDYDVVVARDACTSPESDNHEQLMTRVFPRMSRVRTVDEIGRALGQK